MSELSNAVCQRSDDSTRLPCTTCGRTTKAPRVANCTNRAGARTVPARLPAACPKVPVAKAMATAQMSKATDANVVPWRSDNQLSATVGTSSANACIIGEGVGSRVTIEDKASTDSRAPSSRRRAG